MQPVTQHRSAGRALERPAPQDGHPRLDRLRHPRLRRRRQGRHEHASRTRSRASASPARPTASSPTPTPTRSTRSSSSRARRLKTGDPEFRAVVDDVTAASRRRRRRHRDHRPVRQGRRRRRLARRPRRARRRSRSPATARRTPPSRRRSTQAVAAVDAAAKAHPGFRVEQSGGGSSEDGVPGGLQRPTSRRPARRRCRSRCSSCSSPSARWSPPGSRCCSAITGVVGDDGPRRPAQPAHAGRRLDQPRHPAHRPRRRRGLLAVLPAPRARGTRRRAQQRGGDRGGRRDLRARRAHLRRHGDDRDGRDVLRRRGDVHVVRDGHDRRRRRGHARLAHRAAGDAVAARRPRRQGPRSRARPPQARAWPRSACGRASSTASCAARCCGRSRRSRCCWRSPLRRCSMDTGTPGTDTLPQGPGGRPEVRPPQGRVPERDGIAERRRQGRGRDRAGRDRRDRRARAGHAAPTRRCSRARTASTRTSTPTRPSTTLDDRGRRRRTTSPSRRSTRCATTSIPATLGQVDGLEAYATGGTAVDRDFNDSMISHLPLVFGFVILAAFLLLLVTFRSIVVPIKAIVLNLLSVGAAYGAMVLVFQHGWFNSLLGVSADRPDRVLDPAVHVRGPVRAVDGLPRVHPQPGPRALRPRHEDRGRRRRRRSRAPPAS